ncbi:hypothetical protein, partial [Cellulomonas phragmiteti]
DRALNWNVFTIKHAGPHPWNYHNWVLTNMEIADDLAQTEPTSEARRARFIAEFKRLVVDVVKTDPTIVRAAYWKCRDDYRWR